jgi:hypothetical protein
VSSRPTTRLHSLREGREPSAPPREGFAVVEPAARTTLFPAPSANDPVRVPADRARNPSERPRFADGGTQIMSVPDQNRRAPGAGVETQHFSVERLRSRRAELDREQELNRQLEQELALLTRDSGAPEIQPTSDSTRPATRPSKLWLRLGMLGLLLASVAMLLYKPAAEPAALPRPSLTPAPPAAPEGSAPAGAALPQAAAVVLKPHATLQRAAADVIAEGRYAEALPLYRQLAESEPDNAAYAEVVQILARRIVTTPKLDSAPH